MNSFIKKLIVTSFILVASQQSFAESDISDADIDLMFGSQQVDTESFSVLSDEEMIATEGEMWHVAAIGLIGGIDVWLTQRMIYRYSETPGYRTGGYF